ncbi:MAG: exodeoxyribonuclease VII small subunit [Clostridia bacterium]|nr:exodeoxyribonuclease VII small subunit [Clostridia bacterium]
MLSKDFDFESSLKELEKIATMLENEQISLEESIALFEKGVSLSNDCSKYLENAKQRIITLTNAEEESENNA